MSAKIIDGRAIAKNIRSHLKKTIEERLSSNLPAPGLSVILVGDDPASHTYVKSKRAACHDAGILSFSYERPSSTTQEDLLSLINQLNQDPAVHGILVQLPLPKSINTPVILDQISPAKDVDGFHPHNLGLLAQGRPLLRPCTPYGIMQLLQHTGLVLKGLHAVVVGASTIVGRPMALELLLAQCTVTVCHSATRHLDQHIRSADLLVSAIGKTGIIRSEWIKPGAIVIDVGMNRLADGRLTGDIEFESAKERAAWITPVPGGVGPMTVTTLLQNTLYAANHQ